MKNKNEQFNFVKRESFVSIRFSKKELDKIQKYSKTKGLRVATWLRMLALEETKNEGIQI